MMLLVCLLGLTANCCALWFCWLGPFVFSVIIKTHTAFYCQSHNFDVPLEIHFCLFIKYSVLLSHANGAIILTPSFSLWPLKFVNSEKWFFFPKNRVNSIILYSPAAFLPFLCGSLDFSGAETLQQHKSIIPLFSTVETDISSGLASASLTAGARTPLFPAFSCAGRRCSSVWGP